MHHATRSRTGPGSGNYNPHQADCQGMPVTRTALPKSTTKPTLAHWVTLGALIVCATVALEAHADSNSVALVTEVSGVTKPPLSVHREIAPGTRIDLAPGAHISLLHYSSCTIVAVAGGSATVTDQGIEAKATDVESRKPGPCPRVHRITHTGPGPLGGVVVTRGEPKPYADVGADSEVILSGNGAAEAIGVEVLDVNRRPVDKRIAVRDASFKLDGTLAPKRSYVLRLSFSGQREPLDVPVLIGPSSTAGMLIIRLE
jgi:hypothetical protein